MIDFYWQSIRLPPALIGTFLLLAGVGLLYRSWSGRLRTGPLPGWILVASGLAAWTLSGHSLITGPAGLVWLMLMALGWIALRGQWPSPRTRPSRAQTRRPNDTPAGPSVTVNGDWKPAMLRMLVAGPLAATSALAVSLALATWLPGEATDRGVAGLFLAIILWAAALVWSCTAPRLSRPAAGFGLATLLAALSLLAT